MQLVGATGSFIKRPFLIRSVFYGGIAGLLASALIASLYQAALNNIPDLEQLQDLQNQLLLYLAIVFIGMFVAYFSTFRAINRYLKLSLDDLY